MSRKKGNRANRTQVCNLKICIKETLLLSKARPVITENILLLNLHCGYVKIDAYLLQFLSKYRKQVTIAALNGEDFLMLLPNALKKSQIYQVLPFIVSRDNSLNSIHLSSYKDLEILILAAPFLFLINIIL